MINSAIMSIKNNPMLYMYLKYHSYWYKELLRNPSAIREMIEEMKMRYAPTLDEGVSMAKSWGLESITVIPNGVSVVVRE